MIKKNLITPFNSTEKDIFENKKNNVIYIADFSSGEGKYLSVVDSMEHGDLEINISPKIQLRITYIAKKDKIAGVEISKLYNAIVEKIHFSTMAFERILQLLKIFSKIDLKSITSRTLQLDKTIIQDKEKLENLLNLVATDPTGKDKLIEIVKNFKLIKKGDIDDLVERQKAVKCFDTILNSEKEFKKLKEQLEIGKDEEVWQRFFQKHDWILGSDYVEILDQRNIDEQNITDYLLESYDGFVDIIELKLHSASFWTKELNPSATLIKAIMQCIKYISETEKKIDSKKFNDKLGDSSVVKPKITLIYGRSNKWDDTERENYRILNSSFHNISVLTFDHVLERAKRIVGISEANKDNKS